MDKTFIFDMDDTILKSHHKYSLAQLEFVSYAIKRLGPKCPDTHQWINLEVDIDKKLVETMGFSSERFPLSFKKAYETVCESLGIEDKEGAERSREIGKLALNEEHWKNSGLCGFMEGVEETLDYLVEKEDELILLTKGDRKVQLKKIELYNLGRWFSDTVIVDRKDGKTVSSVVGRRDIDLVWHVGNLIKSDVIPALDAGIKSIYIPCETWAYEKQHNGIPQTDRVITLDSIKDIKEKYNLII